jgi:hypothetical protein
MNIFPWNWGPREKKSFESAATRAAPSPGFADIGRNGGVPLVGASAVAPLPSIQIRLES